MQLRQQRRQTAFARWRRLALSLVAIVAAVLAASPPAVGQSRAAVEIPRSGRFQSPAKGWCLAPSNGGYGQDVIQAGCTYAAHLYWNVVQLDDGYIGLQNRFSWQCLDGLGAQQSWDVIQSDCGWGDSQHWLPYYFNSEFALINKVSWKCLDVSDWGQGVNVYQYDCHYWKNQRWSVMDR